MVLPLILQQQKIHGNFGHRRIVNVCELVVLGDVVLELNG
jgi:hypothetical protein